MPNIFIFFWITMGLLCAYLAHKKHKNIYLWFGLGVFFGIFALLGLFFIKIKKPKTNINDIVLKPLIKDEENNLWYYLADKKQFGPMSMNALTRAFKEGKISHTTYVWNDTMKAWKKIKELLTYKKIIEVPKNS